MQQVSKFFLFISIIILTFYACEKVMDDKIPPTLVLLGSNPVTIITGCEYKEPGFILKDDKTPVDAINLVVDMSSVNTDSVGVYYINYSATDADGNTALASRRVQVKNLDINKFYTGKLLAKDTIKPFNQVRPPYHVNCVLFSATFNWIKIFNFNNFGDGFDVIMIPDSLGNLLLTYSLSDTLINGTGSTYCDMSGFRLEYQIETPEDGISVHHVTYKFD